MEDSHIACLDLGNGVSFFGVYDGHGGKYGSLYFYLSLINLINININLINSCVVGNEVAEFVRDHLVDELKKLDSFR